MVPCALPTTTQSRTACFTGMTRASPVLPGTVYTCAAPTPEQPGSGWLLDVGCVLQDCPRAASAHAALASVLASAGMQHVLPQGDKGQAAVGPRCATL